MKMQEKIEVMDYINGLYNRIECAKNAIRDMNYGTAERILAKPFPKLDVQIDD